MGCLSSTPTTTQVATVSDSQISKKAQTTTLHSKTSSSGAKKFSQRKDKYNANDASGRSPDAIAQATHEQEQSPRAQDNNDDDDESFTPDADEIMDLDPRKSEHDKIIQKRMSENKIKAIKIATMKEAAFDQQIKAQQSNSFKGLYQVFNEFATNYDKAKMDVDGLVQALATFGLMIGTNKNLKMMVYNKFDLEKAGTFDFSDFQAVMASFIASKDEEGLFLLFQIMDLNENGYLDIEDMARVILTQNQIAICALGHSESGQKKKLTKPKCLKIAKAMVDKYDSDDFKDDKISFDEFQEMFFGRDENDLMISHMDTPSMSAISAIRGHSLGQSMILDLQLRRQASELSDQNATPNSLNVPGKF